jgi:hypothetical protein
LQCKTVSRAKTTISYLCTPSTSSRHWSPNPFPAPYPGAPKRRPPRQKTALHKKRRFSGPDKRRVTARLGLGDDAADARLERGAGGARPLQIPVAAGLASKEVPCETARKKRQSKLLLSPLIGSRCRPKVSQGKVITFQPLKKKTCKCDISHGESGQIPSRQAA